MTDVVDLSGGDNFIGIPAQLNNTVGSASLPAALSENSTEVRFSLAKLNSALDSPHPRCHDVEPFELRVGRVEYQILTVQRKHSLLFMAWLAVSKMHFPRMW